MKPELVYESYSDDGRYRVVITKRDHLFDVRIQEKKAIHDLPGIAAYCDFEKVRHITDSFEKAVELGQEDLKAITLKPKRLKTETIGLSGTKQERIHQAVKLSYTEVSREEFEYFCDIYRESGIPLLPSAAEFFRKYGGTFRNYDLILDEPIYNNDVIWYFYAGMHNFPDARKEALKRLEDAMDFDFEEVRAFAKQEVCPLGEFGFYYPPVVFTDTKGRLLCRYEYQEEIGVFTSPEDILASQLGNHKPIAIERRF